MGGAKHEDHRHWMVLALNGPAVHEQREQPSTHHGWLHTRRHALPHSQVLLVSSYFRVMTYPSLRHRSMKAMQH